MPDPTLGAYTRHEKYDAADFANAEFARHRTGVRAVRAPGTFNPRPWSTAGWVEYTDAQMAQDGGWSPVRECPNPDQHTIATLPSAFVAAAPCSCSAQRARAEKAEKERDHWKREADGANEDLAHLAQHLAQRLASRGVRVEESGR